MRRTYRGGIGLALQAALLLTCGLIAAKLSAQARLVALKPPPPVFHFTWREEITDAARRLAVADVTGDGKPRLILLLEKPQQRGLATLLIKKWDGTAFVTEFTGDVNAPPDKLEVGRFTGPDKPAVIVTADALWFWNGKTYVSKPAFKPLSLFGSTRMRSGAERLIVSESAKSFKTYQVDPTATTADWLTDRTDAPTPPQVEWENMHAAAAFFEEMGMPTILGNGGLISLWDIRKANAPYLFYARSVIDPNATTNSGATKMFSYVAFRDPSEADGNELWYTQKLNGTTYDVALQDPRSAKRGLLILTSDATPGKSRTLYFYALD